MTTGYKRVLLKLSGEALAGNKDMGIDAQVLDQMSLSIAHLVGLGVQVGIVVGGGELIIHARKTRVQCDRMGIIRRHRLEFYRHVDNRHTAKEDSPTA